MGFMSNLFGKKENENAQAATADTASKINLRKEKVSKICLEKNITTPSRVGFAIDYSGSMSHDYRNGNVQELLERIIPIALNFDDDGSMDVWKFDDDFERLKPVTLKNYENYVNKQFKGSMGCTSYAPVLNDIYNEYVVKNPSKIPAYIVFTTDGNCDDYEATRNIIKKLSEHNVFIQFVGIGAGSSFLEELDNMDGRFLDNVNYFYVESAGKLTDDELYRKLLAEYPSWLTQAKSKGLI